MKLLFDKGIVPKLQHGLKILGRGADQLKYFGVPIHIEASDASESALNAVKETGGSIKVEYRTPLLMRKYLKP